MNENERCPECGRWGEECAFPTAQPGCGCARCLRAQRDEARAERDSLLAVIHRDGGHYIGEHGVTKAVADAHATWAAVVRERDEARAARDHFKEQLRERAGALLDARAAVERCHNDLRMADAAMRAHARTVAERQREACARAIVQAKPSASAETQSVLETARFVVRATPLVTEGDK